MEAARTVAKENGRMGQEQARARRALRVHRRRMDRHLSTQPRPLATQPRPLPTLPCPWSTLPSRCSTPAAPSVFTGAMFGDMCLSRELFPTQRFRGCARGTSYGRGNTSHCPRLKQYATYKTCAAGRLSAVIIVPCSMPSPMGFFPWFPSHRFQGCARGTRMAVETRFG